MRYLSAEIVVPRPRDVVWGILTDLALLTQWVVGLEEAEHVGGEVGQGGMRVEVVLRRARGRHRALCEVTAWRAPQMLAIETRGDGGQLHFDRVELVGGGAETRVILNGEIIAGSGWFGRVLERPNGLLGVPHADDPLDVAYVRSVEAFRKLVTSKTAGPYR